MDYKIICKGSRRWTEDYTTLDDLKNALKYYGLPLTLATFGSFDPYGMSINRYQHYEVIAYIY